jgi:exopolysaccharide biosynthesis polyprenyl glycosylphosphotransferase
MESSTSSKILSVSKPSEAMDVLAHRIPRVWQWRLFVICLILIDTLAVGLAFRIAYFLRFEISANIFQLDANPSPSFYQTLAFFLIPSWLALFAFFGLYDRRNLLGGTIEYARVLKATTTGMILVIFANFALPEFILARGWLMVSWILSFFIAASGRFLFRRVVYLFRTRGYFLSPAIIVGANSEGRSLAEQLTRWKTSGLEVIGFVDKKLPVETPVYDQMRVLGSVDQLNEIISQYGIEELILASSSITGRDRMMGIFQRYGIASRVNMRMSSGLYEIITTGLTVKEFAYVPLVGINKVRLTGVDQFLKLILDYCVAVPVLLLFSPLIAIIALGIKFDSKGGVIYRRRVLGLHGRQFDAFKFRTMHANGDEILAAYPELESELAQNHKIKDDPRVTRLGKFLRKFSLDELPQFVNVLRREMSVVGPRMITPEEIEKYEKWHLNLLTVRPGITGYWQVNGRSDVSYEERVRLDMHYIRNWSIWFDLQLLLQTIPAVLRRRGAY